METKKIAGLILLLFFQLSLIAQNSLIRVQLIDDYLSDPVPFAQISFNDGKKELISDIDGFFSLDTGKVEEIKVHKYGYFAQAFRVSDLINDSLPQITLSRSYPFIFEKASTSDANLIISRVFDNKYLNDPLEQRPVYYETYNKFYIETDKIDETKSLLEKFLDFFSLKIKEFPENHHALLVESYTKRLFENDLKEYEKVVANKVSGIEQPKLLTFNSQIQPLSIYSNYIEIAKKEYTGPISKYTDRRYIFTLLDTIKLINEEIYVIKFNPKKHKHFEALKGFLYINASNYAIRYCEVEPAINKKVTIRFIQSTKHLNGLYFPDKNYTKVYFENIGSKNLNFIGHHHSYLFNIEPDTSFHSDQFGEIVLEYNESKKEFSDSLIKEMRRQPLSETDSNTYEFYANQGRIKNIDKLVNIGERLYFKEFPAGPLDIDLSKIVKINQLETIRLGMGAKTNDIVSEYFSAGAYIGYGSRDNRFKWGSHFQYSPLKSDFFQAEIKYTDDVAEAGLPYFAFDRYQYNSEGIRRFRVRFLDYVEEYSLALKLHPLDYLRLETKLSTSKNKITTFYRFEDQSRIVYNYAEIGFGLRYGYGEKFVKIRNEKISTGSDYPVFWFQYHRGLYGFLNGDFSYNKYDFKIRYNRNFIGYGKSSIQLIGGLVKQDIPYFQLYNMKGARNIGTVVHNSFETMRYNEFLSSRYISVFYSHDFGNINYFSNPNFRPRIEMNHNIGFGTLDHPDSHKDYDFKTMEKGYFESGVSINNLIMFKTFMFKSGFGTGLFYRYGPLRNKRFIDNVFGRLTINFRL